MHATVEATRVVFGSEFIPRAGAAPDNLIVRAGTTVRLPEDATYRYVEVGGTLRISRQVDTILRFVDLVILPGGVLDIGTEDEPNLRHVELIGRNMPIDTSVDPYQWGHGLVNFGTQYRVGRKKLHAVVLDGGLTAGQTVVKLPFLPEGWEIGDELQIPDTDQPSRAQPPREERPLFIAQLVGTTVTLSKGLDFDHLPITDPEGVPHVFPRILNLTRNIVVRSEDPAGVPTHTADIGMHAISDVRFNRIEGCGRTTTAVLNNTVQNSAGAITQVGTNQVGKYADHLHHAHGHTSIREGNVLVGHPRGKWGLVLHGTHDVKVARNIATLFSGASFVTEDGPEIRNVFHYNIATYSAGVSDTSNDSREGMDRNRPGTEGTGFWMHGVRNSFVGNEAWNCFIGFNLFNQQQPSYLYPGKAGGEPDTAFGGDLQRAAVPLEMRATTLCANVIGLEYWATHAFPCDGLVCGYNGAQVFVQNSSEVQSFITGRSLLLGKGGRGVGITASVAYVGSLRMEGDILIAGCAKGVTDGGGRALSYFRGLVMQNVENFDFNYRGWKVDVDDCRCVPFPGRPERHFIIDGSVWPGGELPAAVATTDWLPNAGSRVHLRNWQQIPGNNYTIFPAQALGSHLAMHSVGFKDGRYQYRYNSPERGKTVRYTWETYGIAPGGEAIKDEDVVPLAGLIGGYARSGLASPLGPPAAVMTTPTMREPSVVQTNDGKTFVPLMLILSGDPSVADDVLMVSIDGAEPLALGPTPFEMHNVREFRSAATSVGTHTVELWRRRKGTKDEFPGSRRTFKYFVGTP